ncbi:nuclear transport factor 2 family protein [Gymnodinialimonas sp.]
MFKPLSLTVMVFMATAGLAQADVAANRQLVLDMLEYVFAARDPDAVQTYFTEDYIQRNPMLPSGSATIEAFLSRPVDPDAPVPPPTELHRIFGEGDLVATHSTYYNFGPTPMVAFDVFRIEGGRIAEHWDNLTPLRSEPNPAGRTQVDGATEVTDLDQTQANRELVLDLVERMFIGGERVDVTQYINPTLYLQHNPDAGDGLQGLQDLMAQNAASGMAMQYRDVGLVVAEGNFVLTGAEGTMGDQPTAFYDLWRLDDGLIVEHWDVIAPIPTENLPEGYPGKF